MTVPTPYVSISPSLGPEGISRTVSGVGFTPGDWATFTYKTGLSRPKEELSAAGLLSPTGLQFVGETSRQAPALEPRVCTRFWRRAEFSGGQLRISP